MKNIIILFMLLCFVSAQAQETETVVLKSKGGIPILPVAGDIAIGAEALPYLEYLGNMFNNTEDNTLDLSSPSLYFRYYLTDKSAIRANLTIRSNTNNYNYYVQDDAARFADPLSQAMVVDKENYKSKGVDVNVGYMLTRGYGRLVGFYGAQVGYGFDRTQYEYQYGNAITVANPAPSTEWGNQLERALNYDYGKTQNINLGLFTGVEFYFAPKICIGGEVGLNYLHSWESQSNYKTEHLEGSSVVEMDKLTSPGDTRSSLQTSGFASYAGLYLMFHF